MLLLALAAAAAQPQPGELKTFADWTVGCDNARACRAVALVPEAEDRDAYLLLVVDRDGAPSAHPEIRLPVEDMVPIGTPLTLRVDGKRVAEVVTPRPSGDVALPFDRALASALANGRRASLTSTDGHTLVSASLAGLSAAFLYMDERQRRLGTVGALRRTGPKPDSAVPAPPPLPRVLQPQPSSKPPRSISAAQAAELIGPEAATCEHAQGPVRPRAHRLDAAHSLVLVDHPCGNGAYNLFTSPFIVGENGQVSPARFDVPIGMSETADNELTNGDWDTGQRRIGMYVKARGIGDCGMTQEFAWDGQRFRLVERAQMDECRGSTDYITLWRAQVVTGR